MRFAGTLENLSAIRDYVQSACKQAGAGERDCFDLQLAVDEIATNIVKHGYRDAAPGPIDVDLCFDAQEIIITVGDAASVFDPVSVKPPDLESDWEARAVGGLGWHLVRRVVDDVRYQAKEGGGNIVTLVKRRGGGDHGT